ncbi:hypothetical protein HAX54_007595 [Datura stramonium]|uniref:Ubiquitin-like protease family profile domain-containing protein n=1 Tax=Datura stramonium TaxID=4076 RepID=A0ABS8RV10_DATST|nr:hypothetical protein [Datura stramonium]
MSEFYIALITQAVVSATTINVNVAVSDEAVVDGGVPRQDVAQPTTYVVVEVDDTLGSVARVGNEPASGVFVEGVAVNESVVDPPSKDATCEALVGQVAYEVSVQATYTFTESEHDSPECGIPPGSTIVEIGDDDKMPVIYQRTRNRRPGKAQQSPFVAGSGLCEFGLVSVKCVKGRSPLMPSITVLVDYGLIQTFSSFVDEGMIKKMRSVAVYSDNDDYLEPSYDIEVSSVSKKMWFHTSVWIRRLGGVFPVRREGGEEGKRCSGCSPVTVAGNNGDRGRCGWICELFPVDSGVRRCVKEKREKEVWPSGTVVGRSFVRVSLMEGKERGSGCRWVSGGIERERRSKRDDIVVVDGLHQGHHLHDELDVIMIENLPQQKNSDCGIFTACFAEYFIENIKIPVENFNVDAIRSRYGILLWHYERKKQLDSECSDSENPGWWGKSKHGRKRKN